MNKVSYVEKNKIDTDSIKENQKECIKKNKSILKIQKRFKSERHNVFTEKINKISLSSNDDKNATNWFDRNVWIWNKQRSSKRKKNRLNVAI